MLDLHENLAKDEHFSLFLPTASDEENNLYNRDTLGLIGTLLRLLISVS
jgi:hypothetical protein